MKRTITLLLMFVFCLGTYVYAREGSSLNINTTAYEEYTPNVAEITLTVDTKNKNAAVAANENKRIANNAIEIIKKELDTQNGDGIKTRGYNVSPQYQYKDGKSILTGYKVTNSFTVKIKDVAKIGDIINLALNNGVNEVDSLNFSLEGAEQYCNELMARAAKSARERAEVVAKAMNNKIKGVQHASVSCSDQSHFNNVAPYRMLNAKTMDSAGFAENAVSVEAGSLKINASFNGTFLLK